MQQDSQKSLQETVQISSMIWISYQNHKLLLGSFSSFAYKKADAELCFVSVSVCNIPFHSESHGMQFPVLPPAVRAKNTEAGRHIRTVGSGIFMSEAERIPGGILLRIRISAMQLFSDPELRNDLDLHQNIFGQCCYGHTGTRGPADKLFSVQFIKGGKVFHVGQKTGGFYYISIGKTGRVQKSSDVLQHLRCLPGDIRPRHLPRCGIQRNLTGQIQKITCDYSLRVGADGLGALSV